MKKLVFTLMTAALLTLSATALAGELGFEYGFEDGLDGLTAVTSSLEYGGEAVFDEGFEGRGLKLDGSYGLELGHVEGDFTVSAMVRVTSGGDNRTLFFKNMGSLENENWTGVIFNGGVPTFWVREGWSKRPTAAKSCMDRWVCLVYTEEKGTGRLYVDGELVAEGAAATDPGDIYLGVTYWNADALSGGVDNVELTGRALSREEISEAYGAKVLPVRFSQYEFPSELIVSDLDLSLVPGGGDVRWRSDNGALLSSDGTLTRPAVDAKATLTGTYRDITRSFTFTALGGSPGANKDIIASYAPAETEGSILADLSGNGNHGVVHGDLTGGNFDGGDWVDLPKGLFEGADGVTLVLRLTPWDSSANRTVFCAGNSADEYLSLVASTSGTNLLRAAITDGGPEGERDLIAAPGLKSMSYASVVLTVEGTRYKMYVDGVLSAEGDLGMKLSDLGGAVRSCLGRPVYDGSNFRGTVDEFTIYSSVMSEDEVYEKFSKDEGGVSMPYISEMNNDGGRLDVTLSRDCMLAVSFYDGRGGLIRSEVRKVSGDGLKTGFDMEGAASAELIAFDPATGEFKQKGFTAHSGDVYADAFDGGHITVTNSGGMDATAVVTLFTYDGEKITAIDACDVTLKAHSAKELPLTAGSNTRILITEKR